MPQRSRPETKAARKLLYIYILVTRLANVRFTKYAVNSPPSGMGNVDPADHYDKQKIRGKTHGCVGL